MPAALRKPLVVLALSLAVAAATAGGQAPGNAPANEPATGSTPNRMPTIKFEKYTLPNGLVVILSEDHRLPLVAVNIWYHVGPANELPGRTGFAHLFEHMMFEGSKHVHGNSHFRYLEAAGASNINGTTGFDRTNYFETLPSNQLALALWLESDRMGYLPDVLDQASLTNQQDVVRNERRQTVENAPYGIVEEAVFHHLFPKGHPYYADVIGSHADIQAAKLADVRKFFEQFYTPNNASLAIVGDFDPAEAKQLVEKYFGPLKRGPAVPKIKVKTPPITRERHLVVRDHVQLPRVYEAWLTSPIFKPGDADADLTAAILGGGHSSRLYKKLVYEKQIALDVRAQQDSLTLGSVFEIVATARPGHTAEELQKAIDEELEKLRKDGPEPVELERARNGIETRMIAGLQRLGGFGGVADRLNEYNHYLGTPDYFSKDLGRYDHATVASIRAFADRQLKPNERVVVYGIPGKPDLGPDVPTPKTEQKGVHSGGEAVNADAAWRSHPPQPDSPRPLNLPVPQVFRLQNGLTVLYNYRPELPVVAANLVFNTGSAANPVSEPGLASFTANMLLQGTTTRDANQIADQTALLGARLSSGASADGSYISTTALTRNFSGALGLLADVVLHPTFPPAEVERRRASRLAALVDDRGNPNRVASRVGVAVLFGPKHPYGYGNEGTEQSIKAISRDAMMKFWKTYYVPNHAALVVAGDIPVEELKSLAEKEFGSWAKGEPSVPKIGTPEETKARIVIVNRPGAQQTALRLMQLGVSRSTPDYAALEVMNSELGGLFSSRINLNLREEHGYTYGAGSAFVYRRTQGYFLVGGGIRTDVTGPAVTEIFKEIRRMRDTPMTAAELALAKDSQARSLPGMFESSNEAAAALGQIFLYNLPLDYYQKLPGQLSSVTVGEAEKVAKEYLHPGRMILVCVGDRAKIEPQLEKLNLGAIQIRDTDGKIIK